MKYCCLLIALLLAIHSSGQNTPAWKWAKSDTSSLISVNPTYIKEVVAVKNNRVLWGYLKNKKISYGPSSYGDYALTEYDTLGAALNTTVIGGKVSLMDIQADSLGNWYVFGTLYDTIRFAAGQVYTTNVSVNESMYFLSRLHAGTLALDWYQKLATNYLTTVKTFTVQQNRIYMGADSGLVSRFYTVDPATGNRTLLLTQGGSSYISSLQADSKGNLYVAGSCASSFSGLNFNGTTSVPTSANQYPAYIVRYRSNGQHDWHIWMTDNTCVARKLSLVTNNFIYYSGAVHDTMTLGGVHLHKPAWVFNHMIARLDSSGNVAWVRQGKDTLGGDASLEHTSHAAVSVDSSITLFANVRGYMDWGPGVTSNSSINGQAACVHYAADGTVKWVKGVGGLATYAQQIAGNGTDVWVTGNGRDSFSYRFDAITVPSALLYPPYMARLYTGAKSAAAGPSAVISLPGDIPLTVKPNPASGTLSISGWPEGGPLWTGLMDMTGRLVYQQTAPVSHGVIEINVAGYARGVYILQAKGSGMQYIGRVILR